MPDGTAAGDGETAQPFRILSLEGGGIMGAFSASALATLEEETGKRCVDHFDLIAGTSTGGIIAIGLGLGIPAREICDFYRDRGAEIFPNTGFVGGLAANIRHLFRPKHSQEALRATLRDILRKEDRTQAKFGDSRVRLVIPAYDGLYGRIYVFKTRHLDRFKHDVDADAVDVALATAAAPTYFSAARFPLHDASYVDGGVWANCPALVAVTEAIGFLEVERSRLRVLNIGTTTAPFNTVGKARSGVIGWNKGLINLFMTAQIEAATRMATLLAGGNLFTINYTAPQGMLSLDDAGKVRELIGLGRAEAAKAKNVEIVTTHFLNGRQAEPYQPLGDVASPPRAADWQS